MRGSAYLWISIFKGHPCVTVINQPLPLQPRKGLGKTINLGSEFQSRGSLLTALPAARSLPFRVSIAADLSDCSIVGGEAE